MSKIFVINPGATSSKIALFENNNQVFSEEIIYNTDDLKNYNSIFEQLDFRLEGIEKIINNYSKEIKFDAVVGRGGLLPPVPSGAFLVTDELIDCLKHRPLVEHASNLGASLARKISEKFGTEECKSFIYDPVTVDELDDVARISGLKEIERKSVGHALNMRATARIIAEKIGKTYETSNIIVVHVGGGASASAHKQGKMIDVISDDEVMFSSERCGGVPLKQLIPLCYKYSKEEINSLTRKKGGFVSYFGTNDGRKIEELRQNGDKQADIVLSAMAYQISKAIGELATVLKGEVDAIVLTGGISYSNFITNKVKERVSFIAPLHVIAGEKEMSALASGALRVLKNEEKYKIFKEN